jgi:hypothetical protein
VFDRRSIEIRSGGLSIGLDNLFDEIEVVETVLLYLSNVKQMKISQSGETEVCVQINANDLDKLAEAWLQKRNLVEKDEGA